MMSTTAYNARESLSAYMDGELPVQFRDALLAGAKTDSALRADWEVFHCIGDVLRSDDMACHSKEFSRRFAERIEAEPFLFAPEVTKSFAARQAMAKPAWRRPAAIAASLAAVAVVSSAVLLPVRDGGQTQMASSFAPPSTSIAAGSPGAGRQTAETPVLAGAETSRLASVETSVRPVSGEYLMAHRAYSNGLAMHGVVSHVRTAGYDGK